jgi:hypothetical protein
MNALRIGAPLSIFDATFQEPFVLQPCALGKKAANVATWAKTHLLWESSDSQ